MVGHAETSEKDALDDLHSSLFRAIFLDYNGIGDWDQCLQRSRIITQQTFQTAQGHRRKETQVLVGWTFRGSSNLDQTVQVGKDLFHFPGIRRVQEVDIVDDILIRGGTAEVDPTKGLPLFDHSMLHGVVVQRGSELAKSLKLVDKLVQDVKGPFGCDEKVWFLPAKSLQTALDRPAIPPCDHEC